MFLLAFSKNLCFAYAINHWISSPEIANVIYNENSEGDVEISFYCTFDFTPIGGNMEHFSGKFLYENEDLPILITTDENGSVHAGYYASSIEFSMFGSQINFIDAGPYIIYGQDSQQDGFYFVVTFDAFDGLGIPMPNTNYGLISMGLNSSAYSSTILQSHEVPRNFHAM